MSKVKILFPETAEENRAASKLYEQGKAASGTDPQQGLEESDEGTEIERSKLQKLVNRLPVTESNQ